MGEMGEMGSDRPRWLEFLMDGVLAPGKGTNPREKSIYDVT